MNVLDLQGLTCPVVLIKIKKYLRSDEFENSVEIITTDPQSFGDLEKFCQTAVYFLDSHENRDGVYHFIVKRERTDEQQ